MKVFFFFYCLCDLHFSIFEKTQYRKYTHKISFIERKLKIPSPTTHYFSGILWVIPVTLKQHALRLVVILLVYQCFTNISWKHTLNVSTAFQNTGFLQWMCIFQHIPGLFALFLSKSPCPNPHSWTPFCLLFPLFNVLSTQGPPASTSLPIQPYFFQFHPSPRVWCHFKLLRSLALSLHN